MQTLTYKNYRIEPAEDLAGFYAVPIKNTENKTYPWFVSITEAKEWIDNMEICGE